MNNTFIKFGSKVYQKIVGNPLGTYSALLVADLFCCVMRETSCFPFLKHLAFDYTVRMAI